MKTSSVAAFPPAATGLGEALRSINRFFFAPSDTATLGLIRICAGFLILYVHLVYSYDLFTLFGKDAWLNHDLITDFRREYPISDPGLDWPTATPNVEDRGMSEQYVTQYRARWANTNPRLLHAQGMYVWSVWFHVTDPTWMVVIHVGILLCMLLFALGLGTPVTGLVTWLGMLSYVNRATTTYFGMDTIMNVLVLYLTLAHLFARPGTAALSLDRLLWRYRMALRGPEAAAAADATETTSSSATFAIRLMQIHFCVIYMASGLSKLMGSAWWNGTAIWYTLANPEFAALHLRYYHAMLTWLSKHRVLWEVSMTGSVIFTLVLEIGFPFLVWVPRLRWLMVTGSVLLHTGIALFMGLTSFSLMMMALLVAFIPSSAVRQLLGLVEHLPERVPGETALPATAGAAALR